MHLIDVEHASWYRALTLTERLASSGENRRTGQHAAVDWGRAERRLARWQGQYPFSADGHFARRLLADGTSEHDLRRLLGEPAEAVRDRCSTAPDWLLQLERAFSRPDTSRIVSAGAAAERPHAGFLAMIEPVISQGREFLSEGIELLARERGPLLFDRRIIEQALYEPLPERLIQMLDLAMTLELHVSRLKGELAGDTPKERFQSFVERMRVREHAVGFLMEYPVLARQLVEAIDQWATFSLEFIGHLTTDYDTLKERFSPDADLGSLTGVAADLGDTHHGGRSVQIAQFSSGRRIVYKPRDLGVDVHFQELLAWLNERGDHPPFRTHAILNRGTYGWVEFVAHEGCASSEEVRRFYRRQGGYLALLYAIEATDFHHNNLIAAGEHPVLIDLECLFQPRWKRDGVAASARIADGALSQSVLRVGLLPDRRWADDQTDGVDVSALGSVAGHETREPIPFWEAAGTDAMHLARKRMAMAESQNRPTLDGEAATPLAYSEEIEAGFAAIYRLLQENRNRLLSPEGAVGRFDRDEIRVLVRDTQAYSNMLRDSFHPDLLRDALDRDRFFDHLWGKAASHPELVTAFRAERDDLLRGDIPMLKSRPGSRAIWNSDNERIADNFHEPAMAAVNRRLRELSDDDCTRQLWFIRASLATLSRSEDRHGGHNAGKYPPERLDVRRSRRS